MEMTTILITGVNRGIGHALATGAVARGWDVHGTSRKPVEIQGVTVRILDVTDRVALADTAAEIGAIDILINNAGVIGPARQSTLDMDFEGFAETLSINTLAPLAVTQAFLPNLRAGTNPRVLMISSQMASMGYAKSDRIAYRASKVALNKIAQGLATDLAGEGVTVVPVDPGWVRTDMGGQEADQDPTEVAGGILTLADRLTPDMSGTFFRWSGEARDY